MTALTEDKKERLEARAARRRQRMKLPRPKKVGGAKPKASSKPKVKLDADAGDTIARRVRAGEPRTALAKEYGVGIAAIRGAIRRSEVDVPTDPRANASHRTLTDAQKEELMERWAGEKPSILSVAREFGVHTETITRFLVRKNLHHVASYGGVGAPKWGADTGQRDEVLAVVKEDVLTYTQIGVNHGISRYTVEAIAREGGAKRPIGWKPKHRINSEYDQVRLRFTDGESKASIARDYEVHWNTVDRIIRGVR